MLHQLGRGELLAALGQQIFALLTALPLTGGGVHSQDKILAGLIFRLLHSVQNDLDGIFIAGEIGGKTAFIAHRGGQSLFLEQRCQCVEYLGAPTQSLTEAAGAGRHNHKFLDIHGIGRMGAAV